MRTMESRFEINKKVRRILVRHAIDYHKLNFSGYHSNINFSGILIKTNGSHLNTQDVSNLIKELNTLGKTLQFMLTNWHISPNSISFNNSEDTSLVKAE